MAMRIESLAEELATRGREAASPGARRAGRSRDIFDGLGARVGPCSTRWTKSAGGSSERTVDAARRRRHVDAPTT